MAAVHQPGLVSRTLTYAIFGSNGHPNPRDCPSHSTGLYIKYISTLATYRLRLPPLSSVLCYTCMPFASVANPQWVSCRACFPSRSAIIRLPSLIKLPLRNDGSKERKTGLKKEITKQTKQTSDEKSQTAQRQKRKAGQQAPVFVEEQHHAPT